MIGDARRLVADTLAPLGVPCHHYPPGSVTPPAAVVIPGAPYVDAGPLTGAYHVGLQVQLTAASGAHERLDELIVGAYQLLTAGKCRPGPAGPPQVDRDTGLLTARIPVTVHWKD